MRSGRRRASQSLSPRPEAVLSGRVRLLAFFIVLVFLVFGVRLFQLQIVEGELLQRRARQNAIRTMRLEPPRGRILDRHGHVLATTRPAFGLGVVPADLQHAELTYAALGRLVEREPGWLRQQVEGARGARRNQLLRLLDDLSFDHLARVESHRFALPGVLTDVRPRRHYPGGVLAAHLLGTIGEIGTEQLEREDFAGYRPGDVIGTAGLEARLERHLRGRAGGRNVVVDVAGREVELLAEMAPVPGGTVVLALDAALQQEAEAAFADVPEGEAARVGAAVALDVHTGDVLVMVSRPGYDPNAFAGGIDADTWRTLTSDPWKPLQNRSMQNHFPPGSTYKALVAVALLEEGIVTPSTRIFCPGSFRHGRRTYRCWKREGHGWVDLRDALKRSCDVYFYQHGVKLGIDALGRWAHAFGLGEPSGLGLPHEAPGLVPTSAWKQRRLKEPWYPGETVSASIGQGYNLVTPLQLAIAYAALANGGNVLRPRLVLRLESREGRVVREFPAEIRKGVSASEASIARVREGLEAVVMEPRGTGGRARVPGLRVAGKTGTTQVVNLGHTEGMKEDEIPIQYRDHAWFGAFAPAEAPEIAVAVFVEHGRHGSSSAAPIAGRILARWLAERTGDGPDAETPETREAGGAPAPRVASTGGDAVGGDRP